MFQDLKAYILKKNNKKRYFENLIHISISTNNPN